MQFFSLIGCGSLPINGEKKAAKKNIVLSLLSQYFPACGETEPQITLTTSRTGCPLLSCRGIDNCAVSFSSCGNTLWAAISTGFPVGIDVESPDNFGSTFPYPQIFNQKEQHQITAFNGKLPFAAALWACKEATVKCRGTGFTDIAPLDVTIRSIQKHPRGYTVDIWADGLYTAVLQQDKNLWRAIARPTDSANIQAVNRYHART